MAEAVALVLLAVLAVVIAATAGLMARHQVLAARRRRVRELPESERHRREWERTGNPAELDAMKRAIEREEGD